MEFGFEQEEELHTTTQVDKATLEILFLRCNPLRHWEISDTISRPDTKRAADPWVDYGVRQQGLKCI